MFTAFTTKLVILTNSTIMCQALAKRALPLSTAEPVDLPALYSAQISRTSADRIRLPRRVLINIPVREPVLISAGISSLGFTPLSHVRRAGPYADRQHHAAHNQGSLGMQQVRRESAGRGAVLSEMRVSR